MCDGKVVAAVVADADAAAVVYAVYSKKCVVVSALFSLSPSYIPGNAQLHVCVVATSNEPPRGFCLPPLFLAAAYGLLAPPLCWSSEAPVYDREWIWNMPSGMRTQNRQRWLLPTLQKASSPKEDFCPLSSSSSSSNPFSSHLLPEGDCSEYNRGLARTGGREGEAVSCSRECTDDGIHPLYVQHRSLRMIYCVKRATFRRLCSCGFVAAFFQSRDTHTHTHESRSHFLFTHSLISVVCLQ